MNNTVEMNETLIRKMLAYYSGDPARIQHYTKVYTYASMIGHAEHLSDELQHILKPLQFFMTSVSKLQKKISLFYRTVAGKRRSGSCPPDADGMWNLF